MTPSKRKGYGIRKIFTPGTAGVNCADSMASCLATAFIESIPEI